VRQYLQQAAPLVDIEIEGDTGGIFTFRPKRLSALDALAPALELYPEKMQGRLSISQPTDSKSAIWLRPGEPVFERFRALVSERLADMGLRGAVFVDPMTERPYLFHMALLSIIRKADSELPDLAKEETLECHLVGVKQYEGAEVMLCPVEHLLLLKGGHGLPPSGQRLAVIAEEMKGQALAFLIERIGRQKAMDRKKQLLENMPEREGFLQRAFDYQEAELAVARAKHAEKARIGNRKAMEALEEVKRHQKELAGRKATALAVLRREPELITIGPVTFVAHALVVPSTDPKDIKEHDVIVEIAAMKIAWAFEETAGGKIIDVHTPELARRAGLPDNPGFDLLSIRPGSEKRAIEVKGRAAMGDVEVSVNEWAKACNMRDGYWLYAVYDCATPTPRLIRVQDPFGSLLAKAKGSVLISAKEIAQAAMELNT
jgi:hypothetical protein